MINKILTAASQIPEYASLAEGILDQSLLILGWMTILLITNMAALLFMINKKNDKWMFRIEPVAIVAAVMVGAVIMEYLFDQYGYTRILGVAHLVTWLPVYIWVWTRRAMHARTTFGTYLKVYFVINPLTFIIDIIDAVRYFIS